MAVEGKQIINIMERKFCGPQPSGRNEWLQGREALLGLRSLMQKPWHHGTGEGQAVGVGGGRVSG